MELQTEKISAMYDDPSNIGRTWQPGLKGHGMCPNRTVSSYIAVPHARKQHGGAVTFTGAARYSC